MYPKREEWEKSTLSRAIASEGAKNGYNVKLADLDVQQGTSVNWTRRRMENDITPLFSVESLMLRTTKLYGFVYNGYYGYRYF